MKQFLLIICLTWLDFSTSKGKQETFREIKNDFHLHLATKTAYRFILNQNDSKITYNECEPKKIWMLVRHGSRYPGRKLILKMNNRLPELRNDILENYELNDGELSRSILANLSLWSPQVGIEDNKRLVHEGEDEMLELAERFQNRFPEILTENYSNSTYKFRFTATQRTMESKRYFTIGLFGRKVAGHVWTPEPLQKDPILRFYKLCLKWRKEVDKNPSSLDERIKFEGTDYMNTTLKNVSKRLGFKITLPIDDVCLMYVTCAFETAWRPRSVSPWCNLFTKSELEVLEYAEDLKYYWMDGYGYDINHEQACPAVADMYHHLTSENEPKATFYFTHSGTLLKVLAHLGLYKDGERLTHQTFNMDRLWRVSLIDAFATNLAFVLHKCSDGARKILVLHQEKVVKLPGCAEELCPLDTIAKIYHDDLHNCNFTEMCKLESSLS